MKKEELEQKIINDIKEFEKKNPKVSWISINREKKVGFSSEEEKITASIKWEN